MSDRSSFLVKCLSEDGNWEVSLMGVDAESFSGNLVDLNTGSSSSWTFDRTSDKFLFTDVYSLPVSVINMVKEFVHGSIFNLKLE